MSTHNRRKKRPLGAKLPSVSKVLDWLRGDPADWEIQYTGSVTVLLCNRHSPVFVPWEVHAISDPDRRCYRCHIERTGRM